MSTAKTKTRAIDYNKQRVRERRERWIKQVGSMSELYFYLAVSLVVSFHRLLYLSYSQYIILFIDIAFALFSISLRVSHVYNFCSHRFEYCPLSVVSHSNSHW